MGKTRQLEAIGRKRLSRSEVAFRCIQPRGSKTPSGLFSLIQMSQRHDLRRVPAERPLFKLLVEELRELHLARPPCSSARVGTCSTYPVSPCWFHVAPCTAAFLAQDLLKGAWTGGMTKPACDFAPTADKAELLRLILKRRTWLAVQHGGLKDRAA